MSKPLDLVFLWHMHQPDYRDYSTGDFVLPWVYLHAMKDYSDMAYHLEQHPKMKAVVNFVPILLDQLEDYEQQFATGQIRDPLLRLLVREDLNEVSEDERLLVLESCFRSNLDKMVAPYPSYGRLLDLFKMLEGSGSVALSYLSGQYLADLLTWYHLAWFGESIRREHDVLIQMMTKDENFTYDDRKLVFDLVGKVVSGIIPRYRKLAESGQIEISATPHYHPLAPLLLDFNSARECEPGSSLPQATSYPGGKSRVQAHIVSTIKSHRARFGVTPHGIWPAEGAVSTSLIEVLAGQECRWAASGEGVLANSLRKAGDLPERSKYLYRPYRLQGAAESVSCFFRDDRLSDLIGFEYSNWNGKDAADSFVKQLEDIAAHASEGETPLVGVILDGENAWEYYPYNGYHFLNDLYTALEAHASIRTTTYSEYLDERDAPKAQGFAREGKLPGLVAGSWVYGTFSTWIGSPDKNHAWDLLCMAKQSYDMVMAAGRLSEKEKEAAERQLSSCESSDWFWWFGDYNPSDAVGSFDRLYRYNLMQLYRLLKLPVPANLNSPISQGGGAAEGGGTMRRGS
ncbi:MAG: glycoside hydrolase family 57 protein [Gallionellaceae bacterium]|jgi:alpha-amylase/alpha-mannosidase (GH57 family)